jgi:hypothetical protein
MIFVQRPPAPPADVSNALARVVKKVGKTELECARDYYAQTPPPTKAYSFARYKEQEVCQWLDRIYNEKCAYCESIYRAVDSRDIEHFRPKAGVTEAPEHPGYWWLAAELPAVQPTATPDDLRDRHDAGEPGQGTPRGSEGTRRQGQCLSDARAGHLGHQ